MKESWHISRKGNSVRFRGIDYGRPVTILAENEETGMVLLHRESHTTWAGVGFRKTAPALYMIGKLLDDNRIEIVEESEPGYNWRAYVAHARKKIFGEQHNGR